MIDTEAWLVSESDADFQLARVTLDHLRPDEVLVELTASGICHMDIEAKQLVPLPAVLGHRGRWCHQRGRSRCWRFKSRRSRHYDLCRMWPLP